MSPLKKRFTILLAFIALILIGWTLNDFWSKPELTSIEAEQGTPTYTSQNMLTLAYQLNGQLNYRLTSHEVNHFAAEKETWFTQPVMTVYNEKSVEIWRIRANKAKLYSDKMLYLHGDVVVLNLATDTQLSKIETDNAVIDIVTQDINTDDKVVITGSSFSSKGVKLRGNLRNKTAKLLENVETNYFSLTNSE